MDFVFGFFNLIGTLFVGGVTLVLALCAGAWIGGFLGQLVSFARTGRENGQLKGLTIGLVVFVSWAIYCLVTAATIGAAFLSVIGMIVVGLVLLFFAFITCAT